MLSTLGYTHTAYFLILSQTRSRLEATCKNSDRSVKFSRFCPNCIQRYLRMPKNTNHFSVLLTLAASRLELGFKRKVTIRYESLWLKIVDWWTGLGKRPPGEPEGTWLRNSTLFSNFSKNRQPTLLSYIWKGDPRALWNWRTLLAKHYCLSSKSTMTLLSLIDHTATSKSGWQAMFSSFAIA